MNRRIPLIDVAIAERDVAAVAATVRDGNLSMGQRTRELESAVAAELCVDDAVAVSSGTSALLLSLLTLGLEPGDEVIVPSINFVAGASAIKMLGGKPVFADICGLDEPSMDPDDVLRRITDRTRALMPVHYGGFPARMAELANIAARHALSVIEDAAHAPFVRTSMGFLGTIGEMGCFSFHATKNFTMAEGGVLVARESRLLERARALRSHGRVSVPDQAGQREDIVGVGGNFRPSELHSALGLAQLRRIDEDRESREMIASRYRKRLREIEDIIVPYDGDHWDSAYHLMPVVLPANVNRAFVQQLLARRGIETTVHYVANHRHAIFGGADDRFSDLLVAEEFGQRELSLPMWAGLSPEDVDTVVDELGRAVRTSKKLGTLFNLPKAEPV